MGDSGLSESVKQARDAYYAKDSLLNDLNGDLRDLRTKISNAKSKDKKSLEKREVKLEKEISKIEKDKERLYKDFKILEAEQKQQTSILIDNSLATAENLATTIESLPDGGNLKKVLASPFPVKIPVSQEVFNKLLPIHGGKRNDFFKTEAGSYAYDFDLHLRTLLSSKNIPGLLHGLGEDRLYEVVAPLVTTPLTNLGEATNNPIQHSCNQTETSKGKKSRSTVLKNKRPDYLFFYNHMVVLRGELKDDRSQIEMAKQELTEKMLSWQKVVFGDLPYLFAFAMAGSDFRLCLLFGVNGETVCEELFSYNIEEVSHRLLLYINMINMFRIIVQLKDLIPKDAPEMFQEHRSSIGNSIYIDSSHIKKECTSFTNWNSLKKLYELIETKTGDFPHLIRPYYVKDFEEFLHIAGPHAGTLVLNLQPLGYDIEPCSEKELIYAIECVLYAIRSLHNHKWVHRDIRWPNILKIEDDSWMLIDLEHAVPIREDGTYEMVPENFKDYNKSPRSKKSLNWLPSDDIWLVGRLVETVLSNEKAKRNEVVTEKLLNFSKQLLNQDSQPLSADDALDILKNKMQ